ncbi:hypothetical protein RKLH11_395 [Rhodobacteraceae bacterium KLH11]|nr:hypothetical protein RKLH11_395 [Rhodobacteraceae bacterium KLH11]
MEVLKMTRLSDLKAALLAVLIVATGAFCTQERPGPEYVEQVLETHFSV